MKISTDKNKISEILDRGVENIYPNRRFLEKRLQEGKQLTLYVGVDPTGPDLHIGHGIFLRKMRQFQDLGHKLILLIGDFTGMIGDPTDKSSTRVRLTREQVLKNAKNYQKQASKLIDFDSKNKAEIRFNSEWLAKLTFEEIVELSSHFTVQQMLTRDMFEKRMDEEKPIYLHEFMYPLMQGYDCVAMDVDGELGGNDQMFNMLAGRTLMKAINKKEKFVLTTKLLVDPTGKKMGKSEGNMIKLGDSSDDMFGKVMSWPDELIVSGFELITNIEIKEIDLIEKELAGGTNPRDLKARLARCLVESFFNESEAQSASDRFDQLFKEHTTPEDIAEYKMKSGSNIVDVLVDSKLAKSKSDARRLIEGKGVKLDGEVVVDGGQSVEPGQLLQKGKRGFVRLV